MACDGRGISDPAASGSSSAGIRVESAEARLGAERSGGGARGEGLLLEKGRRGSGRPGAFTATVNGTATGASETDFERGLCEIDERLV